MGFLSGIARLLLVVINILFMLIGLAIAVAGFILRFGKSIYGPILDKGLEAMQKVLDDNSSLSTFAVDSVDLGEVLKSLAIGLIIGGLFLVGISFFGCCGACCKIDMMLWVYAIVIIVFVVAEAVAIGLLYGKPDIVKDNVKRSIESYKGLASPEVTSVGWNIIMIQFKCCGVDDYTDFAKATSWNRRPHGGSQLATPIACCKTLPGSGNDFSCAETYSALTNNGETGCFEVLWDGSFANTKIAVPVLVICGIVQLAFIVFAIYIAKADKKSVSPI